MNERAWLVGVDSGGTFTDLIAVEQKAGEFRRAKVPSVSADPSAAVLDALGKLFADGVAPSSIALFVHGTAVATNALLEGKGVRAGLLITRGFRAVYEARGWSQPLGSDLVDVFYQKPPMLTPQWLTEEVTERHDYRGEVVTPLDEPGLRQSVRQLKAKGVEAIAVCFLFSFLNPTHEQHAAAIVAVVNPHFPATVNLYFPTAHLVYNTVLAALGQLNPARAVAPSGLGSGAITIGYRTSRAGKAAVLYELLYTSLGGTSRHDGAAMVMVMNHFTPGTPMEIFESEYPLRVRSYEVVRGSAGAGRYRGCLGYAREFEVLEDGVLTVRSSNHRFATPGYGDGSSPPPSRVILNPDRADREVLDILDTRHLKAGDVIRFERSGGAGFGPPAERAPEAVREDVRNGYVSPDAAAGIYGQPQEDP